VSIIDTEAPFHIGPASLRGSWQGCAVSIWQRYPGLRRLAVLLSLVLALAALVAVTIAINQIDIAAALV
jgi:hypothetical protein